MVSVIVRMLYHAFLQHPFIIGKRVVDFLLVLIELFSLGVTAEALQANIGWKSVISLQREPVAPKFQLDGVAPINYFNSSSQKTKLNGLSYCGIKIWTDLYSISSQITRLTDRRTDGRADSFLIARPHLHCMQRGKNWSESITQRQTDTRTDATENITTPHSPVLKITISTLFISQLPNLFIGTSRKCNFILLLIVWVHFSRCYLEWNLHKTTCSFSLFSVKNC